LLFLRDAAKYLTHAQLLSFLFEEARQGEKTPSHTLPPHMFPIALNCIGPLKGVKKKIEKIGKISKKQPNSRKCFTNKKV
jgi:hypothetical protein